MVEAASIRHVTETSHLSAIRADERAATVADIRELQARFDLLVARLDAQEEQKWLKTKEICQMLGCTDRHLRNLMAEGTIGGDAVRNVGTAKRPEYRYHRQKALDQFLRRS
jgi:hypothetical protein